MQTILIILLTFNGGFVAGICYYHWAHGYVCGALLWLVSLFGLLLDALEPALPLYRGKRDKTSS